ncbi:uncharacterized protein LOC123781184 [Ursus americanus]|uniref:uncharacterized protein LOC123781184 n=1 Tax=Ursus americanus TaxID=9643 RepID=UPI001E67A2A8|nr:uncharacterized protein LOC123781184 [Ursus americanus]
MGTRGLEAGAGHPGPVVQTERGAARRKPRDRKPAAPGGAGPGRRDRQSPQNFAAPGPRPYLQRRLRPRGRGPGELTLSARGGPARRRAPTRARLGQRLGSGSTRAPPPAPRLQPEGGSAGPGRARAVWPRQVLRLQLRGRQLPAPRPSARGRSPARRLLGPRRSRPAAVGGPAPTRALPPPASRGSPPGPAASAEYPRGD